MTTHLTLHPDIVTFPDPHTLCLDAAYRLIALAAAKTRSGGVFSVALAGGRTPAMLYTDLAELPLRTTIDWEKVHLFFGDDRFVEPESDFSNYRLANDSLISKVPIPLENVHRIKTEMKDIEEARNLYETDLRSFFSTPYPRFDLILLGMGEDGHCASLFPGKAALQETSSWVTVSEPGLKPFVPRITVTYPVLNHARNLLFMVAGADKAEALQKVMEGPFDPDNLPSQKVSPIDGSHTWLIDAPASRLLKKVS